MSQKNLIKKANLLYNYSIGVLGLKNGDVMFTSFPKSGNTWVRFFLCNLISLMEWGGRTVDFELLDNTMPELGVSNLLKKWEHDAIPRVVKTHKTYWPLFRNNKSILLIRDPRDVMASYYHFEMARKNKRFEGSFSEFIRTKKFGLESWAYHYSSWQQKADLIVKYEDMKQDDVPEFQKIVDCLDINLDKKKVLEAVKKSRFESIKKVEANQGLSKKDTFSVDFKFARKGKNNQWQDLFNVKDLEFYNKVMNNNDIRIYIN